MNLTLIYVAANSEEKVKISYEKEYVVDEKTKTDVIDKTIEFTKLSELDLTVIRDFVNVLPIKNITIENISPELNMEVYIRKSGLLNQQYTISSMQGSENEELLRKAFNVLSDLISVY